MSLWRLGARESGLAPFLFWAGIGVVHLALNVYANTSTRGFDVAGHDELVRWYRRSAVAAPSVDVFIPNCGEPLELLDNTFRHARAMRYRGRVRLYCLDDRNRPEVAALAARHGLHYIARPDQGWLKKAGNLRYAFDRTDGDFILVLDADFAPAETAIEELVVHAIADPLVGIVQSPQYFDVTGTQNWLQHGAGAVQELFYRWIQPSRARRGSPICVGTNALYRRSALDEIGGPALVENSEDVHTGFDLLAVGYRTAYVPLVVAKGLCPDTFASFIAQQHRWCTGSMSLLVSRKLWRERIGWRARATFVSGGAYYLHTAIAAIVAPLPALVMVWAYPADVRLVNYWLLLPALVQTYVLLPRWHRCSYRLSAFRVRLLYSWAHVVAIWDLATRHPQPWVPTNGTSPARSGRASRVVIATVAWPSVCGLATLVGVAAHQHLTDLQFAPVIALTALSSLIALSIFLPLRSESVPVSAATEALLSTLTRPAAHPWPTPQPWPTPPAAVPI